MSPLCEGCSLELVERPVRLRYLDVTFEVELPACPRCGQVYVTEELARGRIRDVEMSLEDK
jgi:hypothetical protein